MVPSKTLAVNVITLIVLICLILSISVVMPRIVAMLQTSTEINNGYEAIAEIVEIAQTGMTLNQIPQMRMVLRITENNTSWEVVIRQCVDLGNMPRAREFALVLVDKSDPKRVKYLRVLLDGR
ncbi:hypothetical protein [Burkholderia cepacia]|uniref:hypothetical protein n=1 Tax=Burkholderia cepacia TaxID=292 RepID=UPI002652A5FA|nr:hypothetical protein [Burkholderia cepacia]MDN7638799.1 hypothetical protein [Burkholderia cepacia]